MTAVSGREASRSTSEAGRGEQVLLVWRARPRASADAAKAANVSDWAALFRAKCGDVEIPSRWGNVDKPTLDPWVIEQLDTPRELYNRPQTAFVASFVGSANVVGREAAQALTGSNRAFAKATKNKRLFLHSLETSFTYEFGGRAHAFKAGAPLPRDFHGGVDERMGREPADDAAPVEKK